MDGKQKPGRNRARVCLVSQILALAPEEPDEVTIELVQELVHVNHVAGGDALAACRSFWRDSLFHLVDGKSVGGETPEGQLGLLRVAIIEDRGNEVPRVAIVTFDEHGPDIRLAGQHTNVVGVELAMANHAPIHLLEDDIFDLNFGIHNVFLWCQEQIERTDV